MQKFIPATKVYSDFKAISDEVINDGVTFIVLKHSVPAYEIKPFSAKERIFSTKKKKELDIPCINSKGSYALDIDKIIY
jgi:hypothetical protein